MKVRPILGARIAILLALVCGLAGAEVDMQPLHAGFALEYGQMRNLTFLEKAGNAEAFTVNRTIGWIYQQATINERFDVDLALGGLFFQFFPFNKGFDYAKVRNSAVSIDQASARWRSGNPQDPSFQLSFGLMRYKYNPDSRNLGEYLFRSTPYPNTTINGSWDLINSSYSKVKGVVAEKDLWGGRWKSDFLVTMSDEVYPLNDVSLAYVTGLKLGPLELGAGVNLYDILPTSPSLTTPEGPFNSYFTYKEETYYGNGTYYEAAGKYYEEEAKKQGTAGNKLDSTHLAGIQADFLAQAALVDSLRKADTVGATTRLDKKYYSFKGTLLMARASLDLGSLISGKVDLKVYGETDILGWTNYPVLYEDRFERMPIMAGLTLPTFGLLDHLAVEAEYWKSRSPIAIGQLLVDGRPNMDFLAISPRIDVSQPYTKDDIKWSISGRKAVGRYFTIDAQVANDHTRPIRYDFSSYKYETMLDRKAWYYILRLQVNI